VELDKVDRNLLQYTLDTVRRFIDKQCNHGHKRWHRCNNLCRLDSGDRSRTVGIKHQANSIRATINGVAGIFTRGDAADFDSGMDHGSDMPVENQGANNTR
jgi:hypothetical protein